MIYDEINKGIDVASEDYVYFLSSDDALVDSETLYYVCDDIKENYGAGSARNIRRITI